MTPSGPTTRFVENIHTFFNKDYKNGCSNLYFQWMKEYKLTEVKKIGKGFKNDEFESLVQILKEIQLVLVTIHT